MKYTDLNVVILAYSRPDTFEKVVRACEASLTKIKIVLDKPTNELIAHQQDKIIEIVNSLSIDHSIKRRKENYGLVRSVLTTIEEELQDSDHIVLLEDDCVPKPEFFGFVSRSLENYKDDERISTICGTVTKCRFNPWGWATWRHKWEYEKMSIEEIIEIPGLDVELKEFLINNPIEDSIWSLSWLGYQYKNNCTSVFPEENFIDNIGHNNSGVHSSEEGYTKWLFSQVKKN